MLKVYEEIIDFIAAGVSPGDVSTFAPSNACRERVTDLIHREKTGELSAEEKSELEHYLQIEHLMRLAKARARQYLAHEAVTSVLNCGDGSFIAPIISANTA